jgi:hypothetical protein
MMLGHNKIKAVKSEWVQIIVYKIQIKIFIMADDEITQLFMNHLDNQKLLSKIRAEIKATVYKVMD